MKIITLTLNPAFDIHCYIEDFAPFHENLANVTGREAGGKGVNISRALTVNGVPNIALVALGEENANDFRKSLEDDKMSYREILVEGRIRENITVHTKNADETRISFSGSDADASLLERSERRIADVVDKDTFVTFTGRVPSGISISDVKNFLQRLRNMGARLVIDSKSFSLNDLVEMKPYLIKPNEEEIGEYLGRSITSFEEVTDAANGLYEKGIDNVMISLGAKGALLVCKDGRFVATPPNIEALSTIGAGDSSIAGFLAAAAEGLSPQDRLRMAVAYGTAACMTEGTRPPMPKDIEEIFKRVIIK